MDIKEFIEINKNFWKGFQNKNLKENLLVEAPWNAYFITHCMAMQSLILSIGKNYKPLWIKNSHIPIELLQSYVQDAEYINMPRFSLSDKLYIYFNLVIQFIKIMITQKALNFRFDGIKYGDILHDVYLTKFEQGTLQKPNFKLVKIMKDIMKHHIRYKNLIKKNNIKAILASHRIGIGAGCLVRCALKLGCSVYTNSGMHRNTLYLSNSKKQMIEYEYAPTKTDIEQIISLDDKMFNEEFEEIRNNHIYGNTSCDSKYAFSSENKFYKTKDEFCEAYNLDKNKKNVFIMLHALNDHPHSHFKKMIFKDYGDWFLKTLEWAKKDNSVNWIFKEHPSSQFYPTRDIDFNKIFKNAPSHVKFISSTEKLDTRSVGHNANAIVTCVGSAGFEIPALYSIPSITAGDNHYNDFDFCMAPKTKREYFNILSNLKNVKPLAEKQNKQAKAVYMFIYKYCTVDYDFIPVLSLADHSDPHLNDIFFDKVAQLYEERYEKIRNEVLKYSFMVSRVDFKALRTDIYRPRDDYFNFPFDTTKPMGNKRYEVMQEGCKILDALNVPYSLADGTLLGLYRNNNLIEHDTDIDVTVVYPCDIDRIMGHFMRSGFKIGRYVKTYGKVQQIAFYKDEVIFDILFYTKIGSYIYNFCEADYYFKHEASFYNSFKKIEFRGYEYKIPNNPEQWLEHIYGKNWKTPIAKNGDWRDDNCEQYQGATEYDGDMNSFIKKIEKEMINA